MAMTRTMAAASRSARSTTRWNSSDTITAAAMPARQAGSVLKLCSAFSSAKATYAASVPSAPWAKFTMPEPR